MFALLVALLFVLFVAFLFALLVTLLFALLAALLFALLVTLLFALLVALLFALLVALLFALLLTYCSRCFSRGCALARRGIAYNKNSSLASQAPRTNRTCRLHLMAEQTEWNGFSIKKHRGRLRGTRCSILCSSGYRSNCRLFQRWPTRLSLGYCKRQLACCLNYLIRKAARSLPAIHFGGLPRPDQVTPVDESRYLAATGSFSLPTFFDTEPPRSAKVIPYSRIVLLMPLIASAISL